MVIYDIFVVFLYSLGTLYRMYFVYICYNIPAKNTVVKQHCLEFLKITKNTAITTVIIEF